MRCKMCNESLTDFESTRKDSYTKDYLDICNSCFKFVKVPTEDRWEQANLSDLAELDETLEDTGGLDFD